MIVLLDYKGLKLVQRYNNYYIRFIGGQMAETICEFQITEVEAVEILSHNDKIIEIKDIYKKKIPWTMNTFINIGIHDYMKYECGMSEKRIESNMKQLDLHSDIKHEFYEFIMTEEFPVNSAIEVNGYTARRLKSETYLSVLGSYNFLIYLREEPETALADLKKGLPRK